MLQKILHLILIPNYYIILFKTAKLKLESFFAYSRNISLSYYLKTKEKFYTQFSYISYNPYMYPKYFSNSEKDVDYRKSFFFKYIVLYKIFYDHVKILNIYHSKSNYSRVV